MSILDVWTSANWERLLVGDYFNTGEWGGLAVTLTIGFAAIPAATAIGSVLGLMRTAPSGFLRFLSSCYVNAFRNVPLVILVFWAYFVPPLFGVELSAGVSVSIAIILFTAGYIADIIARQRIARHISPGRIDVLVVLLVTLSFNDRPGVECLLGCNGEING